MYIQTPNLGTWTVTVSGSNTPFGPQPYALVVDGGEVTSPPSTPPTVGSLSPNSGSTDGGEVVTIGGTNFVDGATVSFDGMPAPSVTMVDAGTITATTPAHAAGAVDVVVTNPDSQNGMLPNGYSYGDPAADPPPTVSSVSPSSGSTIRMWNSTGHRAS